MEKKLSVVVSVYNEEQALPMFYETTKLILEILPWDYELLFVNDGSRDDSLSILREYAARDEKVKVVSFSRNFGKEVGLFAGLQHALRLAHEQTRAVYFERSAIKLRIRSTVAS